MKFISCLFFFFFFLVVILHQYGKISFQRTLFMTLKVNEKKTLLEYVLDNTGKDVPLLPSLKEYMETVDVYQSKKRPVPVIPIQESFDDFMKELVTRLVMEKSNNVIAYGYKTSATDTRSAFTTFHPSGNFVLTHITSHNWSTIFLLLGPKIFLDLLVNNKGFVNKLHGESVQIFGDVSSHRKTVPVSKSITKFNVLYNTYNRDYSRFAIIRPGIQIILQDIFSFSGLNPGRSSKRCRGLKSLLSRILANDRKCRYDILYAKFIGTSKCNFANVMSNETEMPKVIQFVLLILGKLLPLDAWGGISNKKILKDRVVDFLLLGANEKLHMDDLFRGIKLKDFKWLGRANQISSKQDFELRTTFLKGYLWWLFDYVLKNILRTFWYITETSSIMSSELHHFPQYLWKGLYESWVSKYANKNLVKMPSKIQKEQLPCGKIKLIPKRSSFRVICVPSKRSLKLINQKLDPDVLEKEKQEFERYRKEVLLPVGQILRLKLSKLKHQYASYRASVHSSSEVADQILDYRDSLLVRFGKLPKLYIIKFDMKECYDRLSQPVLMQKLEELFKNEDNNTLYYVRHYAQLDMSHKLKKVKTTIDTKYHNLNILSSCTHNNNYGTLVDKTKTTVLQKGNILEICRSQIYDVVGSVKDAQGYLHLYKRKRGVFQGFSLLSIFCDILYSAMVHDCFDFLWKSKLDFLFVRLVDDFLLLTPDSNVYHQMQDIISGKLLESYGAFVNKDKTVVVNQTTTSPTIDFVGLELNTTDLSIKRNSSLISLVTTNFRTFKTLVKHLKTFYQWNLEGFLLDCCSGVLENVLGNTASLLRLILREFKTKFASIAKHDTFHCYKFIKFLYDISNYTIVKYVETNSDWDGAPELLNYVKQIIVKESSSFEDYLEIVDWVQTLNI